MVSTASTCGISKSGGTLHVFDADGRRVEAVDPETGAVAPVVDDVLLDDVEALHNGAAETGTLRFIPKAEVSMRLAVPTYYDPRYGRALGDMMARPEYRGYEHISLGELAKRQLIELRHGHGSAPKDVRVGEVPYIKVSDLRAGMVNINPTNRVPLKLAERLWRGSSSGLQAFDLLCPERASKNIGDFCILMPGQEQLLLTKEIIVVRPGQAAYFDSFYLLWALTLRVVREQWHRVVFMQTNREDVGDRFHEVEVPLAPTADAALKVSQPFRDYFRTVASVREVLAEYLAPGEHHFFVSGGELPDGEGVAELEAAAAVVDKRVSPAVPEEYP